MTAPGGSVGSIYASMHVRTGTFEKDIQDALNKVDDDISPTLNRMGGDWGDEISEGASHSIEGHGHEFARSFEHALQGEVVSLAGVRYKVDRRGFLHDFDTGRFAGKLVDDIVESLEEASGPGGPISKAGEGISDALGAFFSVSAKSPLISVLVFVFGALAAAITAVVQAVNALAAVLVEAAPLLGALGLQVGTLIFAFHGLGTAISGAFNAKSAEELNAAIAGLTPAAQEFVRSLLPMRDFFKAIQYLVQQNFFTALGDSLTKAFNALGPTLYRGLPQIATALGTLFGQLAEFFGSPTFVKFINDVIPATLAWLGKFGPQLTGLLTAVVRMADAAIPGLTRLGDIVGSGFAMFTSWLNDQIQSGNLTKWLEDMGDTLESVKNLFFAAAGFVTSFLDALNRAGGNDVIDQFTELFDQLGMFFSSPAGLAAMQGFVHLVEALTYAFSGLVFAALSVLIAFESILAFFGFVGEQFMNFINWLTDTAGPAIGNFFTVTIPGFFNELWMDLIDLGGRIVNFFAEHWNKIKEDAEDRWNKTVDFFKSIPGRIIDAAKNFGNTLIQAGKDLMQGLRDGLQWGWDHTVGPILNWITSQIPKWKGPETKDLQLLQPAGKAVMDGFGKGVKAGARDVMSLLGSVTNAIAYQANGGTAVFNTNLNFLGQQPTPQEARAAGAAASSELNRQVDARNIALAVRMA